MTATSPSPSVPCFDVDAQLALRGCLERARLAAGEQGAPVIAALRRPLRLKSMPDLLALFAGADRHERVFFADQSSNRQRQSLLAQGEAVSLQASGRQRFVEIDRQLSALFLRQQLDGFGEHAQARPRLLGGFAFEPHSAAADSPWAGIAPAELILPELLLSCNTDKRGATSAPEYFYTLSFSVTATADIELLMSRAHSRLSRIYLRPQLPTLVERDVISEAPAALSRHADCEDYSRRAAELLAAIERGTLEKAVLARGQCVDTAEGLDAAAVLARLRQNYPGCLIFASQWSGRVFLGASPERLVSLQHGDVHSGPLAGSRPRGESGESDARLAAELFNSDKERREHQLVVAAIRAALAPHCEQLQWDDEPDILKLSNIQHLFTPICGHLREPMSILTLLAELHPTPAVAGWPRAAALDCLAAHESLNRGWYTGPVGWVNDRGEGDFAIALRSLLMADNRAWLYAGAGIVEGSEAVAEFFETELKMSAAWQSLAQAERDIAVAEPAL